MPNQWHSQGRAGRAQALLNICCALPWRLKNQDTLIEQSNILIKQSVCQVVPCPLTESDNTTIPNYCCHVPCDWKLCHVV